MENSITHFGVFMLTPSFALLFFILNTTCNITRVRRKSPLTCFNLWVKLEGFIFIIIIIVGTWITIIVQSQLLKSINSVKIVITLYTTIQTQGNNNTGLISILISQCIFLNNYFTLKPAENFIQKDVYIEVMAFTKIKIL